MEGHRNQAYCEDRNENETCAVPYSIEVFHHFRNRELAEPSARGANCLQSGCIGLEGVEMVNRVAVGPGGHGPAQDRGARENMYREMASR